MTNHRPYGPTTLVFVIDPTDPVSAWTFPLLVYFICKHLAPRYDLCLLHLVFKLL